MVGVVISVIFSGVGEGAVNSAVRVSDRWQSLPALARSFVQEDINLPIPFGVTLEVS